MQKPKTIVLIGAGIMSATLGVFLKHLLPDTPIHIFERLDRVGAESSDAWNNAGTGHAAYCELNYTPMRDASVDISKALHISEAFEISKQFWTYLVKNDLVNMDHLFINDVPHWSFVMGEQNVDFLKKRYDAMVQYPLFSEMIFETDHEAIKEQLPLMMNGRPKSDVLSTTKMELGTDVNFGAITRAMFAYLESCDDVDLQCGQEVTDLKNTYEGWLVEVKDMESGFQETYVADYVFIGAGGGSIPLLEKSDLDEGKGYGGFPVSGQWLRCTNPEIVRQHEAKVYGKAAKGNPPMSVPHLDTRRMNGKRSLLFGPYAGFSTRFLKEGSLFDLPFSIEMHNIWPMLAAGVHNLELTKYLINQVTQSPEERFAMLQVYYPEAKFEDWELLIAGQRVQIIKKDKSEGGVLKFGTEVVTAPNGSLAALLGASPGASTAVSIMLDTLKASFPDMYASSEWQQKIKQMIPSFGESLKKDAELLSKVRSSSKEVLQL
jgi:malate dehydrogenase (quinone)